VIAAVRNPKEIERLLRHQHPPPSRGQAFGQAQAISMASAVRRNYLILMKYNALGVGADTATGMISAKWKGQKRADGQDLGA